jgi:hypothetical protein
MPGDSVRVLTTTGTARQTVGDRRISIGGDVMQRVPQPDAERANLTQPAEKAPVPSIVGYFDGQEMLFVHTEASNGEVGAHLTR